jgi:hypothetical protein
MSITEKFLRAPGPIEISGRMLKRYHITTFEAEIEPGIQKAACEILPELVPQPDDETPPPAGWCCTRAPTAPTCALTAGSGATSSRCGRRWQENPTLAALIPIRNFGVFDRRWIGCIWELAPFGHERSSWVRHILEPDLPDLTGYINDTLPEGRTGGAQ